MIRSGDTKMDKILIWLIPAILILLGAALWQVCRRLFGMAILRDGNFTADVAEDFKKQMDESRDLIEHGRALYDSLPYEDLYLTSFDGLRLHARFYKNGDGRRTLLLSHGFRSSGRGDFAAVLPLYYETLGCSLLVLDHRAHGESEGRYITYGIRERFDVRDWARYLTDRAGGDVQIVLDGISMGATAVLMACGTELPDTVTGVIADCGFTSPWDIFSHILHSTFHLGDFPILYLVGHMARRWAHFGFRETTTVRAMENWTKPALFIHGTADDFVPPAMTEAAYAACPAADKTLILVEGAMHGCGYLRDRARCESALRQFFAKVLEK